MRFLSLVFLVAFLPARGHAANFSAYVVGVTDGDTLTVLTPAKKQVKIRLWGIDSPESNQDFGQGSNHLASQLPFGKEVTVIPRDTDIHPRTVVEIILPDGRNMGQEMTPSKMSWRYRHCAPRMGIWRGSKPGRRPPDAVSGARGPRSLPGDGGIRGWSFPAG